MAGSKQKRRIPNWLCKSQAQLKALSAYACKKKKKVNPQERTFKRSNSLNLQCQSISAGSRLGFKAPARGYLEIGK